MNKRAKLKRYVWFEVKNTLKHLFEVNIFEFNEARNVFSLSNRYLPFTLLLEYF